MSDNKNFSIRARGQSFKYAFDGIISLFRSEHNMWIHFLATIIVIALAIILKVTPDEFALLSLSIGFVWTAEIFNTAIEKTMDFITTEKKPAIKLIKDLSAAAVLIASITALIVGCFIFIPKI
ncbi:MAG TPA: diacylglycerol kinase family protein [Chitinophagaceae bacterium]|nr:diacylglycerol kinase family protein [Chitinophagaceae bacterium]MCB9055515.1 diacylglycerol kinase family protein [Chitinophagales bacterium]HPG11610.1 diacylglycerol kinase family protein [Chitinophagaceae bacterium]